MLINWELAVGYALTSWVTAELRVPLRMAMVEATFLDHHEDDLPDFESIHHRDETLIGLGDIAFGARFSVLPPGLVDGLFILVSAGITLPSGGIGPDPFVLGEAGKYHQHVFFGSGTVDPYGAVAISYRMTWLRLLGFLHARGSLYANRYGYRGPGTIYSGLDASTDFGLEIFGVSAGVHVMHELPAKWGAQEAKNSGRTDLLAATGLSWQVSEAWRVYTGVKVPVWTHTIGGQLSIPVIWDIGVQLTTNVED